MTDTTQPRESLAEILRIERARGGDATATLEDFWGESQGGDLLARAALAAAATCPELELLSLHAQLLRPAPPGRPLALRVERLADERGIARRQVRVEDGALLCQVFASFASDADGVDYQDTKPPAVAKEPESLPSTLERATSEGWAEYARGPVEFRRPGPRWSYAEKGESCVHVEWVRARASLGSDPRLHMAALVFLAGFYTHWPFERRIGQKYAYDRFTPLDLALWVHRPARWDGWWLLETVSEVAHAGRALSTRRIFSRDGALVASASQSALVAST
jgi:acyl-CoA thioesterase-2